MIPIWLLVQNQCPKTITMDFSSNSNPTIILLFILTFFLFPPPSKSSSTSNNYNTLVYRTCENKTFNHKSLLSHHQSYYSQTLGVLFQQLIAESSQAKFFKTMELMKNDDDDDDDSRTAIIISGFFQCRDDMSSEDCFSCVNSIPLHISNSVCGVDASSARVQLQGCYIHYETRDVSQTTTVSESKTSEIPDESIIINNNHLLHKECGNPITTTRGEYDDAVKFRELMEEAFVTLQVGIVNSNGYLRTSYKSVEMTAQCEGDYSGACECSECVSDAVNVAKEQCDGSLSAEIYIDKCFISYVYHFESGANGNNNNTAKLAAIVVGGAAVLFLGFIFVSLINSRFKKHDYE